MNACVDGVNGYSEHNIWDQCIWLGWGLGHSWFGDIEYGYGSTYGAGGLISLFSYILEKLSIWLLNSWASSLTIITLFVVTELGHTAVSRIYNRDYYSRPWVFIQ